MLRSTLLRRLSLVAFALLLGAAFAPRALTLVHAQEGEDGEDEGAPKLTDEQKKEARSILKTEQRAGEAIQAEEGEKPDYEAAGKLFQKLCDKLEKTKLADDLMIGPGVERISDKKINAHYNLACCLSRTGKKDDAAKELARSVELGFYDWKHIAEDKDLDAIRDMDAFKAAVESGKKAEKDKLVAAVTSGKAAFPFALDAKGEKDKKVTLETYKGKVLVLTILAARSDALDMLPAIQKASESLKEKDVAFLGILGPDASLSEAAEKLKITFPLATSEANEGMKTAIRAGAFFMVIDRAGKVRAATSGVYQDEAIVAAVQPLLDEKPAGGDEKK